MNQQDPYTRIVKLLNEAMLDDACWPEVSALIDEAFGAKGNILTFADEPTQGDVQIFFTKCYYRGVDRSAWLREYFRDYYPEDQLPARVRALPDAKIVRVADLFSEEERRTSRMYNEALVRCHAQNGLVMRLDEPRGSHIAWVIADPIDGRDWSQSRIDLIVRVLPHLRQYVRVRTALADNGTLGTSIIALLDHNGAGVIQLDRRGRIVEANDRAQELLRRSDGLSDRGGALRAVTPEDDSRLQDLLARALPRFVGHGVGGSMVVRRSSLLPRLAVHVKPVTNREVDYRSRHVAALVLIVDPLSRARIEPELVQAALGLTPAEAEVALLIAQGRTLPQIAATTGRGYSTVRTHLNHVFGKLGVSRQLEVAQIVRALSLRSSSRD